jgi:hypothetical protein
VDFKPQTTIWLSCTWAFTLTDWSNRQFCNITLLVAAHDWMYKSCSNEGLYHWKILTLACKWVSLSDPCQLTIKELTDRQSAVDVEYQSQNNDLKIKSHWFIWCGEETTIYWGLHWGSTFWPNVTFIHLQQCQVALEQGLTCPQTYVIQWR